MFKFVKSFLIIVMLLVIISACTNDKDSEETTDPDSTNPIVNELDDVGKFYKKLEEADEYSYEYEWRTHNKVEDKEDLVLYHKVAQKGDKQAYAYRTGEQDEYLLRYVKDGNYVYEILIFSEDLKYVKKQFASDSDFEMPDDLYNVYKSYFTYQSKENNVKVNDFTTTKYTYKYYDSYYSYYITDDELVVKIEWESDEYLITVEILNLKFTNIDVSIFEIPTEEDGYIITDETQD